MNMLIPEDGATKAYNPNRDIAHFWPQIAIRLAQQLDQLELFSPILKDFVQVYGVTNEELEKSMEAYLKFLAAANPKQAELPELDEHGEPKTKTVQQALEDAGFLSLRPAANFTLMSMLGMLMTGTAYAGIMDATVMMSDPCATLRKLVESGTDFMQHFVAKK